MILNIEPFELTTTCTTMEIDYLPENGDGTFDVKYKLLREDGYVAEQGNKTLPKAALALFANPDINGINQMLAAWGITATSTEDASNNAE